MTLAITMNTVGSGDSFVAGCAAGLCRGQETIEVIKLGMTNTQFFKTGVVSVELVEQFYNRIEMEKL